MAPFLITLFVALFLHIGELLWQPSDGHEPDLTSILFISSVLMLLMHPTMTKQKSPYRICRFFGLLLYMAECLVMQYLAVTFTWISFNRLFAKFSPGDVLAIFCCRMLLSTPMFAFSICRWRRKTRDALEDAMHAVYMELLAGQIFMPVEAPISLHSDLHMGRLDDSDLEIINEVEDIDGPNNGKRHSSQQTICSGLNQGSPYDFGSQIGLDPRAPHKRRGRFSKHISA